MVDGSSDGLLMLKVATIGSPVLGTSGIIDILIGLAAALVEIRKPSSRKLHSQVMAIFSISP